MHTEQTIPNRAYCVSGKAGTSITAAQNGETYTLLTLSEDGQGTFIAIGESVTISDDTALLRALPKSAPALGGGAGANSPTHTKALTSGSTTTLRNGGIYTIKQSELPSDGVKGVVDLYCEHYGADDRLPPGTMYINGTQIYDQTSSETYESVMANEAVQQICSAAVVDHHLVLTSLSYGALTVEFVGNEYPVTITTVVEGHEETHAAGTYADLSGLSIGGAVTTAEIWFDCDGETLPEIIWPTGWEVNAELTYGLNKLRATHETAGVVIDSAAAISDFDPLNSLLREYYLTYQVPDGNGSKILYNQTRFFRHSDSENYVASGYAGWASSWTTDGWNGRNIFLVFNQYVVFSKLESLTRLKNIDAFCINGSGFVFRFASDRSHAFNEIKLSAATVKTVQDILSNTSSGIITVRKLRVVLPAVNTASATTLFSAFSGDISAEIYLPFLNSAASILPNAVMDKDSVVYLLTYLNATPSNGATTKLQLTLGCTAEVLNSTEVLAVISSRGLANYWEFNAAK